MSESKDENENENENEEPIENTEPNENQELESDSVSALSNSEPTQMGGERIISFSDNLSMQTIKIIDVVDPENPQDIATKNYVDNIVSGFSAKQSVRVATTTEITLSSDAENGNTIDDIVLVTNDRLLIKDQGIKPLSWNEVDPGLDVYYNSIAYGNGNFILVSGDAVATNKRIHLSADGVSWTSYNSGQNLSHKAVEYLESKFYISLSYVKFAF